MHKSYSIGNAAKLVGVSVSTLRSWEEHGLITPKKSQSGHRYYVSQDVERAQRIKRSRHISGMSLAAIKRRLRQDDEKAAGTFAPSPQAKTGQSLAVGALPVGAKVRQLRQQREWSIRQLSEQSGISSSQLSTFERGHSSLGLARLNRLAMIFGLGLADLLGGTNTGDFPLFRPGTGRIVEGMGNGVRIEQITVAERLMDVELWTIEPDGQSEGFYSHEGEEFIYVIEGEFELTLATSGSKSLQAGESAYFSSHIGHRWRNVSSNVTRLLWINTDSGRLSSLHFNKGEKGASRSGEESKK